MPIQRHYEIVFLVNPDRNEQLPEMIRNYETIIKEGGGTIHRLENWGSRPLAYLIKNFSKANYVLANIECDDKTLYNITESFRYNDDILRHLVLKRDEAITEASPLMAQKAEKPEENPAPISNLESEAN